MRRWTKRAIVLTVALGAAAAITGGVAASAVTTTPTRPAAANSCHAQVQENVQWPLETEYRVVAWCDSLDTNTQAQGTLDMHWAPDSHTDWFTDTGVKHYSGWHFALWGVTPSARVDYAPR
jgi:hypothetical protein